MTNSTTNSFPWAVVAEDLSVCDRFATAEEATERLADYGSGFYVGYVEEPASFVDDEPSPTKDITDLTPEDCDRIVELFMEFGSMLAAKDEWDMDDNFDTTEAVYGLYCEITGHGS